MDLLPMAPVSLCLLLTSIQLTASTTISNPITASCQRLVPGIDRIAHGVDVTRLDLFSASLTQDDGFRNRVIDYFCTENKTWTSPYDNVTYHIPDQIDRFVPLSAGIDISKSLLFRDISELQYTMSREVGFDLSLGFVSFSQSQTVKKSINILETEDKLVATNKAFVDVFGIALSPPEFLRHFSSDYLNTAVANLPNFFDNCSASTFMSFFSDYGTHYFQRGDFGGSLSSCFQIEKHLLQVLDEEGISEQVEASFLGILKAHKAYEGNVKTVDQRFQEHSFHQENYYGGIANLLETEGYKKWWPTIGCNPWLHSGTLVPVTDLLGDGLEIKNQLLTAYPVYMLRAYIRQLIQEVQAYLANPNFAGDVKLINLQKDLKQIGEEPIPSQEKILEFAEKLKQYILDKGSRK